MKCFPVSPDTQQRLRTYSRLRDHCIQFQIMENCAVRKISSIVKRFGDWHATDPLEIGVWCGQHAEIPLWGVDFHSFFWLVQCSWYLLYFYPPWFFPIVTTQQQTRKRRFVQPKPSEDASLTGCLMHASPLYVAHYSVTATLRSQDYCEKPVQRIQVGFDVSYCIQKENSIIKEMIRPILQPTLSSARILKEINSIVDF